MIGDKIKKLRELNNLTAKELAERTGLTASYISQLENNKILFGGYMVATWWL